MKNRICILLALLIMTVSGCGITKEEGPARRIQEPADGILRENGAGRQDEKLRIVTTIFPPYDFARKIGGEHVEVTMLLKPGMESHSYEPTPADIIRIMNSDIFIYAGGESDVWVEELLEGNDGQVESYALLDWVEPLEEETAEGMQVKGHSHEHEHGLADAADELSEDHPDDAEYESRAVHLDEAEYDEHVWTSPVNAMLLVEELCSVMALKDPAHAEAFKKNAGAYEEELEKLDSAFKTAVENGQRRTIVFGDRFPLLYFVKTYGLDYYAAFPGCSMETEPSAAMIAFLTDKVKEEEIPVIFYLEMSNGRIAEAIAETTGAQTMVFYSGHSITAKDLRAGEDYLSLMYRNVEALEVALAK